MKHSESEIVTDDKDRSTKLTNRQLAIELLLLSLVIFVTFLCLVLFSFDPRDQSWSQTTTSDTTHNWGGILGAYFADILLQLFGFVAYLIPFALFIPAAQLVRYFYFLRRKSIDYFAVTLKSVGLLGIMLGLVGFFALNVNDSQQYPSGGILGFLLATASYPVFSHIGSSLLFLLLFLGGMTLLTGYSWLFLAEKIGEGIVFITWPLLNFVSVFLLQTKSNRSVKNRLRAPLTDGELAPPSLEAVPLSCHVVENIDSEIMSESRDTDLKVDEGIAEINHDYYAPINHGLANKQIVTHSNMADSNIAPIGSYLPKIESEIAIASDDSTCQPLKDQPTAVKQIEPAATDNGVSISTASIIDQNNIHDSVIHPFLLKQVAALPKPDTATPSYDLLTEPPMQRSEIDSHLLDSIARQIEKSLADFRVKARVVNYRSGPVVTLFEIELAPGIKAARISTLDRDLARSLSVSSVRVVEVIPGKPYIGLELPNSDRKTVYFKEVLDSSQYRDAPSPLTIVLGKDIGGVPIVADIAKMPHLLVAGTTGSGKSVGVNAMILSILYKSTPDEVRFIMIDPKMLELSIYEGIPHLMTEVVTDMKDAANALNWCINEMERRYRLMSVLGVRNIIGYNEKIKLAEDMGRPIPDPLWKQNSNEQMELPTLEKLPYIVVMVDEFADLIMAVGKKIEELIARLAQKARAAGIHLVLATQRPSVDVITGLIKANIPARIGFTVSSKIDSRTILDQSGAESLLGMGDMLYLAPNSAVPIRVHGAFVRDEEVHAVVQDWKARSSPHYIDNIVMSSDSTDSFDHFEEELDPLFDQVVAFVVDKRRASISSVQRQFRIGYNRAARIVEQMEMQGIVSSPSHNGNREVIAPTLNHNV